MAPGRADLRHSIQMPGHREFVDFLYRLVLQRRADEAGLHHWAGLLDAGADPLAVFEQIWRSPEFERSVVNPYLRWPDQPESTTARFSDGVYFMHIPKTAGSSIARYFQLTYPTHEICPLWSWDDLTALSRAQLDSYRVFCGHFQGYLPGYLRRNLTLLTMLRDPLERTLSCYWYARSNPGYPFHSQAMALSLRQYCLHASTRWRIEDYQTTCLLSVLSGSGIRPDDFSPLFGPDYPLHKAIEASTGCAVAPEVRFGLARTALQRFAAVGITDRFQASLDLFSRTLGHKTINEPIHLNRVPGRPSADDLDPQTRQTIIDLTRADRLLYDYARQRFDQTIAAPVTESLAQ